MANLPGDSGDYELIYRGVELSKNVPGMCLEIGLRLGGGTKEIIDAIADHCPGKIAIAIDPYGNIPYEHKEGEFIQCGEVGYTNRMMSECLSNLYPYATEKRVHFVFLPLEDTEFFARYADGVPIYEEYKRIETQYAFVHFDGPHAVEPLKAEIEFFLSRTPVGAVWVFDDIGNNGAMHYYDHNIIEQHIFGLGFELVEKRTVKALYVYNPK